MSSATATMAAAAPDDRKRIGSGQWGTLTQAAKVLGVSTDVVKTIALASGKRLRTRALPGSRVQFSLDDCRNLAAEAE